MIGFIIANTLCLYFLSSIKRENEIHNYISKNEKELKNIINMYKNHGENKTFVAMEKEMNLRSFDFRKGAYHFSLYKFLGYGYGLTYTENINLTTPKISPGGSPLIKWLKISEHWYYYSYFD